MTMASKATQNFLGAVNETYVRGSSERKALTKLVDNINVNTDREAARIAVKALPAVAATLKRNWGL
jgi:hypothetical protein